MKQLLVILMMGLIGSNLLASDCSDSIRPFFKSFRHETKTDRHTKMGYDFSLEKIFNQRVKLGELEPGLATRALDAVKSFRMMNGDDILGEGVPACLNEFSDAAVYNFALLIAEIKDVYKFSEAFEKMVTKTQFLYQEDKLKAKLRVCGLVDKKNCALLSFSFSAFCN